MADIKIALKRLTKWEGGFSNDADDPGGATRWGITEATARRHGYNGKMAELPYETAVDIYRKDYWAPLALDYVNDQDIANQLFQAAVNQGAGLWQHNLQRACNAVLMEDPQLKMDGIIGTATLAAIEKIIQEKRDKAELSMHLYLFQVRRYEEVIEKNLNLKKYRNGWLNRAKDFLYRG